MASLDIKYTELHGERKRQLCSYEKDMSKHFIANG